MTKNEDRQFIARVKAALADKGPSPMQPISYGPQAGGGPDPALSEIEERVRENPGLGDQLAALAFELSQKDQFDDSLSLFDRLITSPELHKSAYNNALWAVMSDNNKMPVQRDRVRRYLDACLPHGPENPSIFYNAACNYYELGELERVFEQLQLAVDHGYPRPEQMRHEPLFAPIADDPRFVEIFAKKSKET